MKHKKVLYAFAAISSFLAPLTVAAQATITFCFLFGKLQQFKTLVIGVIAVFAILSILYAAFLFLTGGGDEEKQKKAKTFLIYGLIGIAVALFAFSAINSIASLFGLGATNLAETCTGI